MSSVPLNKPFRWDDGHVASLNQERAAGRLFYWQDKDGKKYAQTTTTKWPETSFWKERISQYASVDHVVE